MDWRKRGREREKEREREGERGVEEEESEGEGVQEGERGRETSQKAAIHFRQNSADRKTVGLPTWVIQDTIYVCALCTVFDE